MKFLYPMLVRLKASEKPLRRPTLKSRQQKHLLQLSSGRREINVAPGMGKASGQEFSPPREGESAAPVMEYMELLMRQAFSPWRGTRFSRLATCWVALANIENGTRFASHPFILSCYFDTSRDLRPAGRHFPTFSNIFQHFHTHMNGRSFFMQRSASLRN